MPETGTGFPAGTSTTTPNMEKTTALSRSSPKEKAAGPPTMIASTPSTPKTIPGLLVTINSPIGRPRNTKPCSCKITETSTQQTPKTDRVLGPLPLLLPLTWTPTRRMTWTQAFMRRRQPGWTYIQASQSETRDLADLATATQLFTLLIMPTEFLKLPV